MHTRTFFLALIISIIAGTLFGQNNRSFVSVTGNDANNCTPGFECRSFTRAISVTNAGGEIIAISSGGYGAFVIDKSITVMAALGVAAAITSSSDGIMISAGASDRVAIRGVNITGTGKGYGIVGESYGSLSIENCTIVGGAIGIATWGPSASQTMIVDTVARNAGGDGSGFWITSRATLVRCRAASNGTGLLVDDGAGIDGIVTAVDFVSAGNGYGVYVHASTQGHNIAVDLDRAVISHNTLAGVAAANSDGGCFVRITNSTVTENTGVGLYQQGTAYLGSMKNNLVDGNWGGNTVGTISTITGN